MPSSTKSATTQNLPSGFLAGSGGTAGTNLTRVLRVGLADGTNQIVISETDGSPEVDPYSTVPEFEPRYLRCCENHADALTA